jgi:mannosyltransferase PIG-V
VGTSAEPIARLGSFAAGGGGGPGVTARRRLRDGWRPCLAVFLVARVALSLTSVVAIGLMEPRAPVDVPGRPGPVATSGWHNAIDGTERQDAVWYLALADEGWSPDDASAAFFPLYPMAIRVVSWVLPGDDVLAGLLVSNAAFLGALLVLFAFTAERFGERIARRAIVVAAAFPTAFFFLAPYSESLFLLLSVLTFREARHQRWGRVALFGALAALTRSVGVLLLPAMLVEAIAGRSERRPLGRRLAGAAAIALGPLLWLGWWGIVHGRWLAPFEAQASWQRSPDWPWVTIADAIAAAWRFQSYWLLDAAIVGLAVGGLALASSKLRLSEASYGWLSVLLPLADPFPPRPLLSAPRFMAVVFPALWGLAGVGAGRRLPWPLVIGVLTGGWALCAALFVNWLHLF